MTIVLFDQEREEGAPVGNRGVDLEAFPQLGVLYPGDGGFSEAER